MDKLKHEIATLTNAVRELSKGSSLTEIARLQDEAKKNNPKSLLPFGYKTYSQSEEDGIIAEIFSRIGVTTKSFIEIGVGNGLENNTLTLLFQNWTGLWIEGSNLMSEHIRQGYSKTLASGQLSLIEAFVYKTNIDEIINQYWQNRPADYLDLLSIDIDGNDWHIFKSIKSVKPRVVIIEYNARFVPPTRYCMTYNANHQWDATDNFGVSLQYLVDEIGKYGYSLVACNLTGVNAFFVRNDLLADNFIKDVSANTHFQPPRYHSLVFPSAHLPCYRTLEERLT